eukprot:360284-Chlamydomonas_euryale.AAC.5
MAEGARRAEATRPGTASSRHATVRERGVTEGVCGGEGKCGGPAEWCRALAVLAWPGCHVTGQGTGGRHSSDHHKGGRQVAVLSSTQ